MIGARQILKYTLLPGIVPLFRDLVSSGFSHVSYYIAQIFRASGLLPPLHPYLHPLNAGKFGIRHVLAEARRNLKFRKENTDQIIIFFAVLLGIVILGMQMALLLAAVFVETAHAALPTSFAGFFGTAQPLNDLAFVMMDRVFGVDGMFNSCVSTGAKCFDFPGINTNGSPDVSGAGEAGFPFPFHLAFHRMLALYSTGLLVIAALIFAYYVVVVVVETAQSGTPFGKRFNHIWAPVRMVVALGLLIPVSTGLNSAQYITLYAAKWGSGFATNGWNIFVDKAVGESGRVLGGTKDELVAVPKSPELNTFLEFMTTALTCWWSYDEYMLGHEKYVVKGYLVKRSDNSVDRLQFTNTDFETAAKFYGEGKDILIRFGACQMRNAQGEIVPCNGRETSQQRVFSSNEGGVAPLCGELILPISAADGEAQKHIQERYYEMIKAIWLGTFGPSGGQSNTKPDLCKKSDDPNSPNRNLQLDIWSKIIAQYYVRDSAQIPNDLLPKASVEISDLVEQFRCDVKVILNGAAQKMINDSSWETNLKSLGWGGAALWYNKIAQLNGAMVAAAQSLPYVRKYPLVMETVREERQKANSDISGRNAFSPEFGSAEGEDSIANKIQPVPESVAKAMSHAYNLWDGSYIKTTNNIFIDSIRTLFGVDGLYNIQDNINIHPLAQLSVVGKSLVDSAIQNMGRSLGAGVAGGISIILGEHGIGGTALMASDILFSIAMIGLTAGFVLFYIIPFLPFIYFFFAVGGWIKGIFEAMVGVPLWALAHIRIDGEGMPGDAAMGGYFLIFEVFIRPILIVFGLLASILVFAAQVHVLHEIWGVATSNLAGFDASAAGGDGAPGAGDIGSIENMTDAVGQFFFTVLYTIIVYMTATASFKLVNLVPNHILRWMGANAQAFNDSMEDPTSNLVRNASMGAGWVQQSIGSAQKEMTGGMRKISDRMQKEEAAGGG